MEGREGGGFHLCRRVERAVGVELAAVEVTHDEVRPAAGEPAVLPDQHQGHLLGVDVRGRGDPAGRVLVRVASHRLLPGLPAGWPPPVLPGASGLVD